MLFQEKSITTILKDNPYKELSGGPCVKALDETLARCHVQRQAYHGRSVCWEPCQQNAQSKIYIYIIFKKSQHSVLKRFE